MKRLYDGAGSAAIVFYLIIVVGGFLFGTKSQHDKIKQRRKLEKQHEKKMQQREAYRDSQWEQFKKEHEELEKEQLEELIYHRKMNDPFWHYYDEIEDKVKPIPGDMQYYPPPLPRLEWNSQGEKYYKWKPQDTSPREDEW